MCAHLAPAVGVAVGESDLQQHDGCQLNRCAREARVQLVLQLERPSAALRQNAVYCGRLVLHLRKGPGSLRVMLCVYIYISENPNP